MKYVTGIALILGLNACVGSDFESDIFTGGAGGTEPDAGGAGGSQAGSAGAGGTEPDAATPDATEPDTGPPDAPDAKACECAHEPYVGSNEPCGPGFSCVSVGQNTCWSCDCAPVPVQLQTECLKVGDDGSSWWCCS